MTPALAVGVFALPAGGDVVLPELPNILLDLPGNTFRFPFYHIWAAVLLGLVGAGLYGLAHRYRPGIKKVIPWVLVGVFLLSVWPAPTPGPPGQGHAGVEGMLVGTAELEVRASEDSPLLVLGGQAEFLVEEEGARLVLTCPEGCTFAAGGAVRPGHAVPFVGETVNLTGGPLYVERFSGYCSAAPRFFSLVTFEVTYGQTPCGMISWETLRGPAGSNGTVELKREDGGEV